MTQIDYRVLPTLHRWNVKAYSHCAKCKTVLDTSKMTSIYDKQSLEVAVIRGSDCTAIHKCQQERQKEVPEQVNVAEAEEIKRKEERAQSDRTAARRTNH